MAGALNSRGPTYWQDPNVFYETQYRVLTGSELVRRVVKRLDLAQVPEFRAAGPASSGLNRLKAVFARTPARSEAGPPPSESALVSQFLGRVSVEPVRNSRLVDVAFVSADPAFAVRAADGLADEYVQLNLELRRQNMVSSLEWLSRELVTQQTKVEASERAMAQYREDQQALSLEERQNIVVSRLNQLNDAVTRAKTNRVQKEALYDQVKGLERRTFPSTRFPRFCRTRTSRRSRRTSPSSSARGPRCWSATARSIPKSRR